MAAKTTGKMSAKTASKMTAKLAAKRRAATPAKQRIASGKRAVASAQAESAKGKKRIGTFAEAPCSKRARSGSPATAKQTRVQGPGRKTGQPAATKAGASKVGAAKAGLKKASPEKAVAASSKFTQRVAAAKKNSGAPDVAAASPAQARQAPETKTPTPKRDAGQRALAWSLQKSKCAGPASSAQPAVGQQAAGPGGMAAKVTKANLDLLIKKLGMQELTLIMLQDIFTPLANTESKPLEPDDILKKTHLLLPSPLASQAIDVAMCLVNAMLDTSADRSVKIWVRRLLPLMGRVKAALKAGRSDHAFGDLLGLLLFAMQESAWIDEVNPKGSWQQFCDFWSDLSTSWHAVMQSGDHVLGLNATAAGIQGYRQVVLDVLEQWQHETSNSLHKHRISREVARFPTKLRKLRIVELISGKVALPADAAAGEGKM